MLTCIQSSNPQCFDSIHSAPSPLKKQKTNKTIHQTWSNKIVSCIIGNGLKNVSQNDKIIGLAYIYWNTYGDNHGLYKPCVTVTWKEQLVASPAASLAVYVTAVTPTTNWLPGWKVLVIAGVPESSVAVGGVQNTATEFAGGIKTPEADAGQLKSCGGWFPTVPWSW